MLISLESLEKDNTRTVMLSALWIVRNAKSVNAI